MSAMIAETDQLNKQIEELMEENKKLKEDGANWKQDYEVTHAACKKFELELWRYDAIIKEREWTLERADDCMNLAIRDNLAMKREIADLKATIENYREEILSGEAEIQHLRNELDISQGN